MLCRRLLLLTRRVRCTVSLRAQRTTTQTYTLYTCTQRVMLSPTTKCYCFISLSLPLSVRMYDIIIIRYNNISPYYTTTTT